MIFVYLLLATGLTLSAVAIYYSVIGLTSIFAAAFWPIIIMGTTLEVAKLVAASWLKAYWDRIPRSIKYYMMAAVVVLMLITSMGIFGFLSKAHLDQNLVSGDVVDKVTIIDEKIKTQKENIDAARRALAQMDAAVDQTMARSTSEQGADKAAALRRQQQRERTQLQNDISKAQNEISRLNNERAPIAKELRAVEAEVGPIKYIAKLIYGDNPDANILEKAVTWVIMIIVFVFDPLAVLMLLGAQMTYFWVKKKDDDPLPEPGDTGYVRSPWPFPVETKDTVSEANDIVASTPSEIDVDRIIDTAPDREESPAVAEWNRMIHEAEQAAEKRSEPKKPEYEILGDADDEVPTDVQPPVMPTKPVVTELDISTTPEDPTKKKDHLHDQGSQEANNQDQESVGYVQNSEQGDKTLWQRIYYRKQREGSDQDNNSA